MKNFLNQEIQEGTVVYRSERQGSNNRMVGIVDYLHGDGDVSVKWHFELWENWVPIEKTQVVRGAGLVVLDASVFVSLYYQKG